MAEYQTYYRLHALGFTSDPPRVGVKTLRDLYHETGKKLFRTRSDRPVHDCRHELMKEHTESKDFETWLLSNGLTETHRAVADLHSKDKNLTEASKMVDKLLYKLGKSGSEPGEFDYPRGVCTMGSGDILIADTKNHRIQHFTKFGVFIGQFGHFGGQEGEFNEPCGVTELLNGDVAVADSKNHRVQVFTEKFLFKHQIELPSPGLPYSLSCCCRENDLVVASTDKRLHLINVHERVLKHSFPVGSKTRSSCCPLQISTTYNSEIVVSDPEDDRIYKYSQDGQLLGCFKPTAHSFGLSLSVGGVCVTPIGYILVADTLNHVINQYTETGDFSQQVLSPTEGAGAIYSLALGPEGHLVVSEFSIGRDHCVKVFRYSQCQCHKGIIPASKRAT